MVGDTFRVAKITPPYPHTLIHRAELISLLEQYRHLPLVLLIAHAGSGKTMLAAEFSRRLSGPVAWYRLDESDRDFTQFGAYLLRAIQRVVPEFGKAERGYTFATNFEQVSSNLGKEKVPLGLVDRLAHAFGHDLDRLAQEDGLSEFWLILDDYQFCESEVHNRFLEQVVRWLSPNVHLLMLSREIPVDFPFAEFMARQLAQIIGDVSFQFSLKEVEILLIQFFGIVDTEAARYLLEFSQGWAVIISLALQSLKPLTRAGATPSPLSLTQAIQSWAAELIDDPKIKLNSASPIPTRDLVEHPVFNYLAHGLFNQCSADLQLFLLQTSVLEVLNEQNCDQLLGQSGRSREYLSTLLRQGLLVQGQDRQERFYQYHFLVKNFLLRKLATQPDLWRKVQKLAAEISARSNQPLKALTHWLNAGAAEAAVELLGDIALGLYESGRWRLLDEMLKLLDADSLAAPLAHSQADLIHVKGLLAQEAGQLKEAREYLGRAALLYDRQGKMDLVAKVKAAAAFILIPLDQLAKAQEEATSLVEYHGTTRWATLARAIAQLTLGWVAQRFGQFEEARQSFEKAEKLFEAVEDKYRLNVTRLTQASLYVTMGRLIKAGSLFQRTLPYWQKTGNFSREVNVHHMLATIQRRTGKFGQAIKSFEENLLRLREVGLTYMEPYTLHELGDCYRDSGNYPQASLCYEEAREQAHDKNLGLEIQIVASWSLNEWLEARSDQASELGHEALELTSQYKLPSKEPDVRQVLALVALDRGQYAQAVKHLIEELELLTRFPSPPLQIRALLLLAAAYFGFSKKGEALQALGESFELCNTLFYEPYLPCELARARAVLNYAVKECSSTPSKAEPHSEIMQEFLTRPSFAQYLERSLNAGEGEGAIKQKELFETELNKSGRLELRALDGGRVFDYNGAEITQWSWPKARSLLFYIADNPGVTTEKMQSALWDEDQEVKANTVHALMSHLRRTIPALKLKRAQGSYRLEEGTYRYDALKFERAIRALISQGSKASVEALCQTLGLYHEEFLCNITAEWTTPKRQHLESLYIEGQILLAQAYFDQADYPKAILACRQILTRDRYYDEAHQIIIDSYRALGQELEAHRQQALYDEILASLVSS